MPEYKRVKYLVKNSRPSFLSQISLLNPQTVEEFLSIAKSIEETNQIIAHHHDINVLENALESTVEKDGEISRLAKNMQIMMLTSGTEKTSEGQDRSTNTTLDRERGMYGGVQMFGRAQGDNYIPKPKNRLTKPGFTPRCYTCNEEGHYASNCNQKKCYKCGSMGRAVCQKLVGMGNFVTYTIARNMTIANAECSWNE